MSLLLAACDGAILDGRAQTVGAVGDAGTLMTPDSGPSAHADGAIQSGLTDDASVPGTRSDGGTVPATPGKTCDAPVALVDTSKPTTVVGTGAGTCSEQLLEAALKKGGIITFDCGDSATIPITSQKTFASGVDTTLDGNGKITLDGQGKTRILTFNGGDFQKTTTKLTVQRLHFTGGKASGTQMFASASSPCSQGYQDGSGGAIYVQDADLRIIDSVFDDNQAASPGPDVGGGAVYVAGAIATTVVGSTFTSNQGSNGGAIGALWANLSVYNSTFTTNKATGSGANSVNDTCPEVNGQREVGSGGNGGAIVIDGGEEFTVVICGSVFRGNVGGDGALGGAVFRTPDVNVQTSNIDRCTFDGNEAHTAGALYFHHSTLNITASTFSGNIGHEGSGVIQVDDTTLSITNSTFANNQSLRESGGGGPRGAVVNYGNSGTVQNSTFVGNSAATGNGSAGGALIGSSMFTVNNSLFVNNTPQACDGTASGGNDLQYPSGNPACANGVVTIDPMLGMLQDNGGPTLTVLPGANGPAAKAGSSCAKTDQRGYARAAQCSLGAVEIGATK